MTARQAKVKIETTHHEDGGFTHKLEFSNGQTRTLSFAPDHELFQQFAAHGSKAKLLSAANAVDSTETAIEKVDALTDVFDEGKWSLLGEGGSKYSPLVRALAELKHIEVEAAETLVKAMSKSTQAKLRNTERVATIIARIKGEESKGVDEGDKLLDGLLEEKADGEGAAKRAA